MIGQNNESSDAFCYFSVQIRTNEVIIPVYSLSFLLARVHSAVHVCYWYSLLRGRIHGKVTRSYLAHTDLHFSTRERDFTIFRHHHNYYSLFSNPALQAGISLCTNSLNVFTVDGGARRTLRDAHPMKPFTANPACEAGRYRCARASPGRTRSRAIA